VPIKIKLTEGEVLTIRADPEEWGGAYRRALESNGMIEVHGPDGRTLAINPQQILYWEEAPDDPQDAAPTARQTQTV
jgi:hypothetical protein